MTTTFDPTNKSSLIALTNGDLTATGPNISTLQSVASTTTNSTGKFYCEFTIVARGTQGVQVGIANTSASFADNADFANDSVNGYAYWSAGNKIHNGSFPAYGAAYTAGDIISVLLDIDAGTLEFWKNGVSQGVAYTGIAAGSWFPASGGASNSTPVTQVTANFGATAWAYTPTVGYNGWAPAPPTPGNGAGTFESLTAYGARIAAGAVTLSSLTAVGGMNGFGAATMPALTVAATGGHSGGECTVPALTATGTGYQASHAALTLSEITATSTGVTGGVGNGTVTAEVLDSAGTGWETPISDGDSTFAKLTASGTGTSASVGAGAVTLEYMTAEGHAAPAGAVVFAKPTASASGTVGIIGSAALRGDALTATATGTTPVISIAAAQFNKLTAQGVGTTVVVGTGAVTIQKVQAAATGFGGSVGTAALEIALMTAAATGYPVVTAAGAIVMPAMYADGHATQTVTETYKTWVMNTRNLDLTYYSNYLFNSFTEFNGTQYAAGPAGISKLTGADDAGTDIAAVVRTGNLADTNSGLLKIPEILLTTESAGPLTVSVITDAAAQYDYTTPYVGIDTPIQVRVEPGKGLRGLGYQVEVKNNDGAAFSIVEMNVPLEKTKRRLGDR